MGKIALEVMIGLTTGLAGIFCAFLFLQSLQSPNFLFLILSIILIGVGVKFLFRSTNLIENIAKIPDPLANINKKAEGNVVDKNNQLLSDWKKTAENEARLKMLQLKADANTTNSSA